MCHPPCLDSCGICGGVTQSVTAVCRGDQRELRARRERKESNALGCISKRSREMIDPLSLVRHWVIARPTTHDNDKPRLSAVFGPTSDPRVRIAAVADPDERRRPRVWHDIDWLNHLVGRPAR